MVGRRPIRRFAHRLIYEVIHQLLRAVLQPQLGKGRPAVELQVAPLQNAPARGVAHHAEQVVQAPGSAQLLVRKRIVAVVRITGDDQVALCGDASRQADRDSRAAELPAGHVNVFGPRVVEFDKLAVVALLFGRRSLREDFRDVRRSLHANHRHGTLCPRIDRRRGIEIPCVDDVHRKLLQQSVVLASAVQVLQLGVDFLHRRAIDVQQRARLLVILRLCDCRLTVQRRTEGR